MRPTMPDRTSRRAALACAGLLALSALWPARPAAAQIPEFPKPPEIPDACVKGCQWNDPLCKDREANCVFKLNKYKAYMVLIGAGAPVAPLPAVYVTVLQPFYPGLNLHDVSVAYSPRQLNSIAITDCYTVYFNDLTYFSRVRDAALMKGVDDHKRLYHELTHAEQCAAGGGRDNYAVRWWGELDVAFVNNPNPLMLHDSMPMEGEADARADFVDDELVDGLLPQLFISGMRADRASPVTVNSDVTLTAEAGEGGSAEFAFDVRLEPSGVTTARQAFGSGNVFRWWPAEEGRYRVTASVRRRGLLLPPNEASTVYEVAGAGGGGGSPFASACPSGYVMAGLRLRTGEYVNSVEPVCVKTNPDGRWKRRPFFLQLFGWPHFYQRSGPPAGGPGGQEVKIMCDADWGVRSLVGGSGALVDSLGIRCGRLGPAGVVGNESRTYGPVGGGGGRVFELRCSSGRRATSLAGRAGHFIDRIALGCD